MGSYVDFKSFILGIYLDDDFQKHIDENLEKINEIDRLQLSGARWEAYWEEPLRKNVKEYYNQLILRRKEIGLRFYNFFEKRPFDMNWIEDLIEIEDLDIESWGEILNIEKLANFKNLKRLSLNFGLKMKQDLSFLTTLNPDLEEFSIFAEDKNPKIDLTPISNFKKLKSLSIQHFDKNLEAVLPEFSQLEKLHFRSISKLKSLDCIKNLKNLEFLVIQRGGFEDIRAISALKKVKYLQLWQLPKVENLDFINQMTGLQFLFIETMNGVSKFPKVSDLKELRRVQIISCKNLNDFSEIAENQSIEEFIFEYVKSSDVSILLPIITNEKIKKLKIYFEKTSLQKEMEHLVKQHGREHILTKERIDYQSFIFK